MGDAADWLTESMSDPESDDECAMWDDEDCDCEPIGSCDECESDLYEDDVYFYRGLRLCGRCCWLAKGGPGR
jgi:hypothetical protein